jgi:hypothetical protein
MPYLGKTPSQATRKRYYKTASAGDTSVSGTMTVGGTLTFNDGEFVDVSVNGVALVAGTDYNTNTANTIAGLSALAANDQVEIVVYDTFSVFGGDVDSNLSVGGNLSVTGTTTLTGNADFNGDLDVDGTTNLDAVDIDGNVDIVNTATLTCGAITSSISDHTNLTLTSTAADANAGPKIALVRDSSSPADGDSTGAILFKADDDGGNSTEFAKIESEIIDASNTTEDGRLIFRTITAGTATSRLDFTNTETVFNDSSIDVDFRVESNNQSDMFFVDAGNDRIGIGTNAPVNTLDIIDNGGGAAVVGRIRNEGGAAGDDATLELSIATASEEMRILFTDSTGTAGQIVVDGGDNSMAFESGTTERMRIDGSGGALLVGKTSTDKTVSGFAFEPGNQAQCHMTSTSGINLILNRQTSDGTLVQLRHADTTEGSIVVSGSTVSYNGGHLSRWSQATDGNRIDGLVKGTVMTNLDQMAKWHHEAKAATLYEDGDEIPAGKKVGDEKTPAVDAYTEDNEQLNCMAVSSVEGDVNVAGVFVNWDDDDEDFTADMNIAMTGDMVIRIAKNTTVERGNLLMSAGDGTAKPQGDGYVQDKTIAKVTSTKVSHTYDDGSYLVPCVLMAC